jgi:hypothetical protein
VCPGPAAGDSNTVSAGPSSRFTLAGAGGFPPWRQPLPQETTVSAPADGIVVDDAAPRTFIVGARFLGQRS